MTFPMSAATFSLMLVEVESVGETNAVVIDSYRRRHVIKLLPRRGGGPLPRVGEIWILDKTLGQEWTFAAVFRPLPPVIEGIHGGLSADLAEMLGQMGLITNRVIDPATYYLYDDFTGDSLDTDLWEVEEWNVAAISQDDRLRIRLTSDYPRVRALRTIPEFSNKAVQVEVPRIDRASDGRYGPNHETTLSIVQDGSNHTRISVWLESDTYFFSATATVGGTPSFSHQAQIIEYDPDRHRWWQIREKDGTWHYEWSSDGKEWEEFWTADSTPLTDAGVSLWSGSDNQPSPTPYSEFDNLLVYGPRVYEVQFLSSDVFRKADYPGLRAIKAKAQGAGGSGGGREGGNISIAGGGGGGGYAESFVPVDDLSDAEIITVGAGHPGTSAAGGSSGGNSSFGSHATGNGGEGGNMSSGTPTLTANGGSGGEGSGNLVLSGQAGERGRYPNGENYLSGDGGDSHLGHGGRAPGFGATGGGSSGDGYGGGGGGSAGGPSDLSGGNGIDGIVIVELIYD